jgi:hypothetical protein
MALCNAVSECGSITAAIECSAAIVQGEDYDFQIQLNDKDGNPLDLCMYDAIVMKLYGEDVDINYQPVYYGYWGYPEEILDSRIAENLLLLQQGCPPPDPVTDQGLIGFHVSHEISSHFNTGTLYAEIKLKEVSTGNTTYATYVTGSNPTAYQNAVYTTITCLKIGSVKRSYTRDFLF